MSIYISVYPPSIAAGLRFRIYLHVFFYQLSPENGSRKSSKLDIRSNKLFESHSTTFSVIPNIWFSHINEVSYMKIPQVTKTKKTTIFDSKLAFFCLPKFLTFDNMSISKRYMQNKIKTRNNMNEYYLPTKSN